MAALLSGEAGPDAPCAALGAGGALRSRVRDALTDLLEEPARLGSCFIHRTKYKPGRRITVSFDVMVADHGRRAVSATWRPGGTWPAEVNGEAAAVKEASSRGLASPFRSLSVRVPAWDMRVDVAPLDASFPGLVRLSDPAYAATVAGLKSMPCVSTVRYRPGERHVLRYEMAGSADPGLFVKLYRDDRGAATFDVATAVADHLGVLGRGRAAAPSAYLAQDRAVLVPAVAGLALPAVLRRRGTSASTRLRDAGALLRAFHDGPAELVRMVATRTVDDEVAATHRATAAVRQLVPGTEAEVDVVLESTRQLLARLPTEPPVFSHGDYKADNLVARRDGVTVVDLDRCTVADPALDLAKFLADLRWWLDDGSTLAEAQEAFLAGYGSTTPARLARARALEPLHVVKQAARRVPPHERNWQGRTASAVARARGLLTGMSRG